MMGEIKAKTVDEITNLWLTHTRKMIFGFGDTYKSQIGMIKFYFITSSAILVALFTIYINSTHSSSNAPVSLDKIALYTLKTNVLLALFSCLFSGFMTLALSLVLLSNQHMLQKLMIAEHELAMGRTSPTDATESFHKDYSKHANEVESVMKMTIWSFLSFAAAVVPFICLIVYVTLK